MKNLFVVLFLFLLSLSLVGQNTFPNSGNAGIGTTSPATDLEIRDNSNPALRVRSTKRNPFNGEYIQLSVADCNGCFTSNARAGDVVILGAPADNDFRISNGGSGNIIFSTGAWTDDTARLVVTNDGNIGIGKSNPTDKLEVNGRIHARSVKVDLDDWPDYVFEKGYRFKSLAEIEKFIKKNGHLENLPSREEVVNNGLDIGEINKALTEKIEELTLHLIEKDKDIKVIQVLLEDVLFKLNNLESRIKKSEKGEIKKDKL